MKIKFYIIFLIISVVYTNAMFGQISIDNNITYDGDLVAGRKGGNITSELPNDIKHDVIWEITHESGIVVLEEGMLYGPDIEVFPWPYSGQYNIIHYVDVSKLSQDHPDYKRYDVTWHNSIQIECNGADKEIYENFYNATSNSIEGWNRRRGWNRSSASLPLCEWEGLNIQLVNESFIERYEYISEMALINNNLTGEIPAILTQLDKINIINLSANNLSGTLPVEMISMNGLLRLDISHNKYFFRDLETNHVALKNKLGDNYFYFPQQKTDRPETITGGLGATISLSTALSSPNNRYQWQISTNGGGSYSNIPNATGRIYTLTNLNAGKAGLYRVLTTNTIVDRLTLEREPIRVILDTSIEGTDSCGVRVSDRRTLEAFYDATGGNNWYTNTHWKDPNVGVCDWYGVSVENGKVVGLELSYNGLTNLIPVLLKDLKDLKRINFSYNGARGSLPAELGTLSNLEHLELLENQLEGTIPSALGNLSKLKHLAITNIIDGAIPSRTYALTGGIPSTFANLTNLEVLDLSTNRLSGSVPSGLSTLPKLKIFNILENDFVFRDFADQVSTYVNRGVNFTYVRQSKLNSPLTLSEEVTRDVVLEASGVSHSNNRYQWQFRADGGLERSGERYEDILGATSLSYRIPFLTEGHTGSYRLLVTNSLAPSLTLARHRIVLLVSNPNSFCTSEFEDYPRVGDLTPSGPTILWYDAETGGKLYDTAHYLEPASAEFWWDDTSDNLTSRSQALVSFNVNAPEGPNENNYMFLPTNATVADLRATGANIEWYTSAVSTTALSPDTPLIHDRSYYAEDVGVDTCRLEVGVYVGTVPPEGDGVQYLCTDSVISDIVTTSATGELRYYATANSTTALDPTTPIVDGMTYYVTQIGSDGYESFERTPVRTVFNRIASPDLIYDPQYFYNDETPSISDLLAVGETIRWYSANGTLYQESDRVFNGETYYAEQEVDGCVSERVGLRVEIRDEPKPSIISCEKFKPQLGGKYVISGWAREEAAIAAEIDDEIHFSAVSATFLNLLNYLKNRMLSEDKYESDIPHTGFVPESNTETLNFDVLVPYIVGQPAGEFRLKVYNFERIEDAYNPLLQRGKLIGFKFALNPSGTPLFEYRSPEIQVDNCGVCFTRSYATINYPLTGQNDPDIIQFTHARVSGGQLYVQDHFNAASPLKTETIEKSYGASLFKERVTYYRYDENPDHQVSTYTNAAIELNYIDSNDRPTAPISFMPTGNIIDGWQQIVGIFDIPRDVKLMNIRLRSKTEARVNIYFDDLRVQPYESNMKTFVYDPDNQRLLSELDENNYATYYEYDLEGGLVRVKKETEKGIYTIQETRSGNLKSSN